MGQDGANPSWKLSFPHVCVAIISSFLFGYHLGLVVPSCLWIFPFNFIIKCMFEVVKFAPFFFFLLFNTLLWNRVVNEPLESIAKDLGFVGKTLEEGIWETIVWVANFRSNAFYLYVTCGISGSDAGLVVSICLFGAFIGSSFSGSIADAVGRRRAFQLCALPMIIGASIRSFDTCYIYFCYLIYQVKASLFDSVLMESYRHKLMFLEEKFMFLGNIQCTNLTM